jgi:lysophospholipase L1-like esterase
VRIRFIRPAARRRVLAVLTAATAIAGSLSAVSWARGTPASAGRPSGLRWVTSWSAAPVIGAKIPGSTCPAGSGLADQTVRDVVYLSMGGDAVRVRLTNAFGTRPMRVGHVSVASQASGANATGGVRPLTFGGATGVTVVAGGQVLSDPIPLAVRSGTKLLVSVYVPDDTGPVTNHPFTAQTNYLADGDRTLTPTAEGYDATPCWMLIDAVDTRASGRVVGTVVTLGDSITDTAITTGDADQRWPDHLARRLNALRGPTLSVANAGLGGNRLLAPREGQPYYGVPALARLDRDVFGRTAVRDVILLEGVNDIGYDASAADIIAADRQIVAQSHAQGLRIFGGTIMPFKGSVVWSKEREDTRETVNAWIRDGHDFDGVIDFSAATADPSDPQALKPAYDSGDHLHPGDAGCRAMADAVRLPMLIGG